MYGLSIATKVDDLKSELYSVVTEDGRHGYSFK